MAQAKGLLDLPRELYLLVCANLTTTSLTNLAVVSRDHYLAVQAPLFSRIVLTSYGALIKLEGPLTRVPVVSRISPKYDLVRALTKLSEKLTPLQAASQLAQA